MNNFALLARWENAAPAVGALLFILIHFLMEPARWIVYTKTKNKQRAAAYFYIFSATAFLSYIMPAKLGIPIRFLLIKKYQQIKTSLIGLFTLIEQAFTLGIWAGASLLLGGSFAVAIFRENIEKFKQQFTPVILIGIFSFTILFLAIGWRKRSRLTGGGRAIVSALSPAQIGATAALFILDVSSYIARHFFILQLLGVTDLPFLTIASASVLSIFAGFVSAMPMGLGGYDATIIFLLTQQGVPLKTAVLAPIINRSANILVSALLGIPSAYKLGLSLNVRSLIKKAKEVENVK